MQLVRAARSEGRAGACSHPQRCPGQRSVRRRGKGGETFSENSRAASEAAVQGEQEEGVYGVTC